MIATKRGRGKKSNWITMWAMKASAKGMPMAEITAKMSELRKLSIAEIRGWTAEWSKANS